MSESFEALSPENIQNEILARKDEIIKKITDGLIRNTGESVQDSIGRDIGSAVSEIVKQEMLEEINQAVRQAKPAILVAVTEAMAKVAAEVGTAMVKKVASNMEGYNGKKVIEALFAWY